MEEIGRVKDRQNTEVCVHNMQGTVIVFEGFYAFAIELLEPKCFFPMTYASMVSYKNSC